MNGDEIQLRHTNGRALRKDQIKLNEAGAGAWAGADRSNVVDKF